MLTSTPHRVAANRRAQTRIISTAWFPLLNAQLQPQPLTLADADDVCDLCSAWQVARWLSHLSWAFTSGSATQLILEVARTLTMAWVACWQSESKTRPHLLELSG